MGSSAAYCSLVGMLGFAVLGTDMVVMGTMMMAVEDQFAGWPGRAVRVDIRSVAVTNE